MPSIGNGRTSSAASVASGGLRWGALAVAAAAILGRHGLAAYAALLTVIIAAAAAALAGPERRLWAAAGVVYASAPVFAVCWLRDSPEFGLLAIAFLFAVVWGTGHLRLFWRSADRRAEAVAARVRRQDMVGHDHGGV